MRDLVVPASNGLQRVVLGLNTLDDYLNYSPSFGAVPGRFANRIANGRFVLDGVAYQLERKPGQKQRCTAARMDLATGSGSSARMTSRRSS